MLRGSEDGFNIHKTPIKLFKVASVVGQESALIWSSGIRLRNGLSRIFCEPLLPTSERLDQNYMLLERKNVKTSIWIFEQRSGTSLWREKSLDWVQAQLKNFNDRFSDCWLSFAKFVISFCSQLTFSLSIRKLRLNSFRHLVDVFSKLIELLRALKELFSERNHATEANIDEWRQTHTTPHTLAFN